MSSLKKLRGFLRNLKSDQTPSPAKGEDRRAHRSGDRVAFTSAAGKEHIGVVKAKKPSGTLEIKSETDGKRHNVAPSRVKPVPASPEEVAKAADDYLSQHQEDAITRYAKENTFGGTLTVSSDAAREMLPEYGTPAERRANTFALGPASSRLADAVWQKAMQAGPTAKRYGVVFLTGSPGSGKTSTSIKNDEESPIAVISEGMMDHVQKSEARIQQAIDSGFVPALRLVYAADPRVTLRRAVSRAMEYGRPVRISQMSRLYVEIPKTVAKLAEHFGDRLGVSVFDNSVHGQWLKASTLDSALNATGEYTVDSVREAMHDELDKLRNAGKVSDELYRAFAEEPTEAQPAGTGNRGRSEGSAGDGSKAREDQPPG